MGGNVQAELSVCCVGATAMQLMPADLRLFVAVPKHAPPFVRMVNRDIKGGILEEHHCKDVEL